MENEVVIRQSFVGSVLLVLFFSSLAIFGAFLIFSDSYEIYPTIVGWILLVVFGGISLIMIPEVVARRHVAIISDKGIDIYPLPFITWDNVVKFEIIGKQEFQVGSPLYEVRIFVHDNQGDESARMICPLNTPYDVNDIMEILQRFHARYKTRETQTPQKSTTQHSRRRKR